MNIHILTVPRSEMRPEVDGADWYFQTKFTCPKCGNAHIEPGDAKESMDSVCKKCDPNEGMDPTLELVVKVCPMSDWRYEALLGVHEAVEAIMCKHNGVSQQSVDVFDRDYDETHPTDIEAGDDPEAPYVREHCFATAIERILCAELDVSWKLYDDELNATYPGPSHRETPQ